MQKKPVLFRVLQTLFITLPLIKYVYDERSMAGGAEISGFCILLLGGMLLSNIRAKNFFLLQGVLAFALFTYFTLKNVNNFDHGIAMISLLSILVLLIPRYRRLFFISDLRQWETLPRYRSFISCKIANAAGTFEGVVLNLSQRGGFLRENPYVKPGDHLIVEFVHNHSVATLPAKIVHKNIIEGVSGFGMEFNFREKSEEIFIRTMVEMEIVNGEVDRSGLRLAA